MTDGLYFLLAGGLLFAFALRDLMRGETGIHSWVITRRERPWPYWTILALELSLAFMMLAAATRSW